MDEHQSAHQQSCPGLTASGSFRELCQHSGRVCQQPCLGPLRLCERHALDVPGAPVTQCTHLSRQGRRCPVAVLKTESRVSGLCMDHARRLSATRQRPARRRPARPSPDTLLEELAAQHGGGGPTPRTRPRHLDSPAARALEYASSSDSEPEGPLVEETWQDEDDSDAESVDSEQEDALKYAGAYTSEEVAQLLRDKLIRLQALYIDQFKRLRHVLTRHRREYLIQSRRERQQYGSIKLYKSHAGQRRKYQELVAMRRYHKKSGQEALLAQACNERRRAASKASGPAPPQPPHCSYNNEGEPCPAPVLPLSPYCQKHILQDPAQVLYQPCPFGASQCGRPVNVLLASPFCSLHQALPPDMPEADNAVEHGCDVKVEIKEEMKEEDMVPDRLDAEENTHHSGGVNGVIGSGHYMHGEDGEEDEDAIIDDEEEEEQLAR